MITKLSISEQVLRMLSSFDRSRAEQVDQREVILLIDQLANAKAKEGYFQNFKLATDKSVAPTNITTFKNVPVLLDSDTDRAYCELPTGNIQLPDDRGLVSVSPMKDLSNQFIIIRTNAIWAYNSHQAGGLQNNVGCYQEGSRVYFDQNILEQEISNVLIREFVISSESISDTAPYPVNPEEQDAIITAVFQKLAGINAIPNDKVNDNRKSE